jgi:hypothetical protein
MKKNKTNMRNIFREGNSFRVRYTRKGKTHSKSFLSLEDALAYRMKKLKF